MNVHQQIGTIDCSLFAIATVTCLLFDGDPTTIAFDQNALRQHFVNILEMNFITPFPTLQTRRPAERISRIQYCPVFCICRLPDTTGDDMVLCDDCQEWFHLSCLNWTESPSTEKWFCSNCLRKSDLDWVAKYNYFKQYWANLTGCTCIYTIFFCSRQLLHVYVLHTN